jgi:hypothetical protein
MKKILILSIVLLFSQKHFAQTVESFSYWEEKYYGKDLLGINPALIFLSNRAAPYPEKHKKTGFILDIQYRYLSSKQYGGRFSVYNKGIGDLIYLLGAVIKNGSNIYAKEETTLSNIFGWFDYTINLNKPDKKFQISAGANIGDYIYAGRYRIDSLGIEKTIEPQGYYLAAGPSLEMRYLISKSFMLELGFSYAFTLVKFGGLDNGANPASERNYPVPHFAHLRTEIISKWGFFAGYDFNFLINNGSNPAAGRRSGITLGYKFDISKK